MNKAIQYRDDGKFYGLVSVPDEPHEIMEGFGIDDIGWIKYNNELKACISAGKEIINAEVLKGQLEWVKGVHGNEVSPLKVGDIFNCPDNIEFEEDEFCAYHNLNCSYCGTCAGSCYKPKKVIRLKLKQEVKTELKCASEMSEGYAPVLDQVKEQSQDATKELLLYINDLEIRTADEPLDDDEFIELIKSKFTIQRNKNI